MLALRRHDNAASGGSGAHRLLPRAQLIVLASRLRSGGLV